MHCKNDKCMLAMEKIQMNDKLSPVMVLTISLNLVWLLQFGQECLFILCIAVFILIRIQAKMSASVMDKM